ncbi:MAG: hypothetical protein ACYC1L_09565 [Alphaproteobacteria bacterium]
MPHLAAEELKDVLSELGRRWAESPRRRHPAPEILDAWDKFLDDWLLNTNLPLILRSQKKRGERLTCSNGREIIFSDNSAAHWAFCLALGGKAPDIASWKSDTITSHVPISFIGGKAVPRGTLNKEGWKICHIESVSDRRRYDLRKVPFEIAAAKFRRFMSPRNMFLVPKLISGVGEIPQVINAIAAFNERNGK